MIWYFTYGSEGQPFRGGWTKVIAPNAHAAEHAFLAYHPLHNGFIPCCTPCVPSERFMKDDMYKNGNFGAYTQETIVVTREVYGKEQDYDEEP